MINGSQLRDAYISAANHIVARRQEVDALNVFPVPDGDTGTNMSMTISAAVPELKLMENPTVAAVAKTAASALLRGARGNSGVILSLLFRGFSKGLAGKKEADGADFAQALTMGVEAAYKAVMKPTEGTILTGFPHGGGTGEGDSQDQYRSYCCLGGDCQRSGKPLWNRRRKCFLSSKRRAWLMPAEKAFWLYLKE